MMPTSPSPAMRNAVGYALYSGLDVAFGDGDALPARLPADPGRYEVVVVQYDDVPRLRDELACFAGIEDAQWEDSEPAVFHGGQFHHRSEPTMLFVRTGKQLMQPSTIEMMVREAGLSRFRDGVSPRLVARPTRSIHGQMFERCLQWQRTDWSDVMSFFTKEMIRSSDATDDGRGLEHARQLFDIAHEQIPEGAILGQYQKPDTVAPTQPWALTTLVQLTRRRSAAWDDAFLRRHCDYLIHERLAAARLPEQWTAGICKMLLPVMAVAEYCGRVHEITDQVAQIVLEHEARARDPKTRLWHYWNIRGEAPEHVCGHGADLFMYHICDVLECFPREHKDYPQLVRAFVDFAQTLAQHQQPSGAWNHILDLPHSIPSTGYTSAITTGLYRGVRMGLLPTWLIEPARRGWEYLKARSFQGGWFGLACGLVPSINLAYLSAKVPLNYDYLGYPPVMQLAAANEAVRDAAVDDNVPRLHRR